uniref:NADH-ubiquinone oxidoreductase chain 2 n=1 Tax=Thaumastocoris safordi TaxID=1589682 RepID=A0A8T9ZXS8_9HEMI|nr:NADH dehydrogenase subunit 2 [Thaumastocoris safordi]
MKNMTKIMIYMTLIASTMIIISSKNWINMWIGMEINLMSFIPLIFKEKNNATSEASMIYFLAQSLGSILFMISIINSFLLKSLMINNLNSMLLMSSLMIKLGSAPFHYWMTMIVSKINWFNILILMTWQKIGPLSIITNLNQNMNMNLFIIMCIMVGAMGSLGFSSMKLIMAYSSINHLGWMMASIKYSSYIWILYMIIYTLMMSQLTMFFIKNNIKNVNQFNYYKDNKSNKMMIMLQLLSMGGLPPMIGFWMKISVIYLLIMNNDMMMTIIMVMFSMITLFAYMRSMSSSMLMSSQMLKYKNCNNKNNNYMFIFMNLMYIMMMSLTIM